MPTKYSLALALLVLAGCAPANRDEPTDDTTVAAPQAPTAQAPTPGASPSAPQPAPPPANALPAGELPGEYRLAGVDGGDINLPYGISASIDGRRIQVVADCINMAWSYTYAGGRLATKRAPVESCARGLTAKEDAVAAALDGAQQAVRTPSNAIELSGDGHSLTLFSQ